MQRKGLLRAGHHPVRPGGLPSLSRRRPNSFLCRQASTVGEQTSTQSANGQGPQKDGGPASPILLAAGSKVKQVWDRLHLQLVAHQGCKELVALVLVTPPTGVDKALQAFALDWKPAGRDTHLKGCMQDALQGEIEAQGRALAIIDPVDHLLAMAILVDLGDAPLIVQGVPELGHRKGGHGALHIVLHIAPAVATHKVKPAGKGGGQR